MTTWRPGPVRGAFTVAEAIVVAVVIAVLVAILLPTLTHQHRHCGSRQLKDSSQIRGLLQGMILWANSNQDRYPLPSRIDANNATVPELAEAKDTTANIMSLLVFNSFFPPELLVSPAEANGRIRSMEGYELDKPAAAVDPASALWDPALRADFTTGAESHDSFAHTMPRGGAGPLDPKAERWGATYLPTQPAIGNRGPEITAITRGRGDTATPTYMLGKDSLTFLIHGSRTKWEGNMGYNDNHVNFETDVAPEALTYTLPSGKPQRDVLFFDETDAAEANSFLGIFIKGGPEKSDFKSIWD